MTRAEFIRRLADLISESRGWDVPEDFFPEAEQAVDLLEEANIVILR